MTETARKKKLIEVALPLDEINAACKADKDRKTGTIRNLHKWFAPMPLPAWRALLFAALVDDPEDDNDRVYLLNLIKRLVANGADAPEREVVAEARGVLRRQYPDGLPPVMDPFCGGGSTLVEAQRLGIPAVGSDLNPVPVLITRTLTEALPSVWNGAPAGRQDADVNALDLPGRGLSGYSGLEADLQHYAKEVMNRAERRLRPHFHSEKGESVVAWLWARTAKCPNPTCAVETVLTTSWWLSKKKDDLAWIEPSVRNGLVTLTVRSGMRSGAPKIDSPKTGRGAQFSCVSCSATLDEQYLMSEGKSGRLGLRLTAVASDIDGRRGYREPTALEEALALAAPDVDDFPDIELPDIPRWFSGPRFGVSSQADLYTKRQLLTLSVFAEEIAEAHAQVVGDGGSREWADAICALLALALGKMAQYNSAQGRWLLRPTSHAKAVSAFDRHDVPMMWDFPEVNVFYSAVGGWNAVVGTSLRALAMLPDSARPATVTRGDARTSRSPRQGLIATDPPYFDAIGYADLSDFFYVWHRRSLRTVYPELYATLAAPKSGELTAIPAHHGRSAEAARNYFIAGFTDTFDNLRHSMHPDLPMLVVYASKEQKAGSEEETRWSSILTAIIAAELEVTGTWPIHGTGSARMIGIGANAVASYIVMTCRPRSESATSTSLGDFARALRRELSPAVRDLQAASILPVDLAQAAIGPGMRIFSRYRAVLDQTGKPIGVDQALRLINLALAEVLDEQEGELDRESRFAVRWWEAHGWAAASFGEADKAVRPLGISVDDVVRAQVASSHANKVQLLGNLALNRTWTPSSDLRPTAWEAVHHLADRLIDGGGELEAAKLMAQLADLHDPAMALAYRLHDVAARQGRTADQERYNALINSWTELVRLSNNVGASAEGLF